MKIKHLQLNTSIMREPEKIASFVEKYNFDTICLQEICFPIGGENKLKTLLEGLAIDHVFSKDLTFLIIKTEDIEFSNHKAVIAEFEI